MISSKPCTLGREEQPKEWDELVLMRRFKSDYDSEDYVPELPMEWLSTEERLERQLRNEQERAEYLDGRKTQGRRAPPGVLVYRATIALSIGQQGFGQQTS
jgi:hypothetical protein